MVVDPQSALPRDPREPIERLLLDLGVRAEGLSEREAARRLVAYGPNELRRGRGREWPRPGPQPADPPAGPAALGRSRSRPRRGHAGALRGDRRGDRAQRRLRVCTGAPGGPGCRGAPALPPTAGDRRSRRPRRRRRRGRARARRRRHRQRRRPGLRRRAPPRWRCRDRSLDAHRRVAARLPLGRRGGRARRPGRRLPQARLQRHDLRRRGGPRARLRHRHAHRARADCGAVGGRAPGGEPDRAPGAARGVADLRGRGRGRGGVPAARLARRRPAAARRGDVRRRPDRRERARGAAPHDHPRPRGRSRQPRPPGGSREAAERGRDARLHGGDLHGQDGHADGEQDAAGAASSPRPARSTWRRRGDLGAAVAADPRAGRAVLHARRLHDGRHRPPRIGQVAR